MLLPDASFVTNLASGLTKDRPQIEMLPRDLGLDSKSRLTITPIPELESLRRPGRSRFTTLHGDPDDDASSLRVSDDAAPTGSLLDLRLNCTGRPTSTDGAVGVRVLIGEGGSTYTTVGFNYSSAELFIDHRKSSKQCPDRVTCGPEAIVQTAPLQGGHDADEGVQLTVMLDNGLVEAYINDRSVMSVWVTEVMNSTAAGSTPADRTAAPLTPPPGVSCRFASHELAPLPPIPSR